VVIFFVILFAIETETQQGTKINKIKLDFLIYSSYISNVRECSKQAFPTIGVVLFSFIYILHLNILIT